MKKLVTTFALVLLIGCGSSTTPSNRPASPVAVAPTTANVTTPGIEKTTKAIEPEKAKVRRPAKKESVSALFAVPEAPPEVVGIGGANVDSSRPHIRLLGFSKLDGDANALIEIKGEVLAIQAGDLIEGAEVVALDNDMATFQFAGQRWSTRLFDQPWLNEQQTFSAPAIVHNRAGESLSTASRENTGYEEPTKKKSMPPQPVVTPVRAVPQIPANVQPTGSQNPS